MAFGVLVGKDRVRAVCRSDKPHIEIIRAQISL